MNDWLGLDSGGTEQLWNTNTLELMLEIFSDNQPVFRNDPDSIIYEQLEAAAPEITWRNRNKDGSFRPIFRKANPLKSLKLTEELSNGEYLTETGNKLIIGSLTFADIVTGILVNHTESDGTNSFRILASAFINNYPNSINLKQIEFGISKFFTPEAENLQECLDYVDTINAEVETTRKRRLRHMLKMMEISGAVQPTKTGWELNRHDIALNIAKVDDRSNSINPSVSPIGTTGTTATTLKVHKSPLKPKIINTASARTLTFKPAQVTLIDPSERILLLEKASQTHEKMVHNLAKYLETCGCMPIEELNSFDVAISKPKPIIFEIKSITQKNAISQIRKAIAQLPEYRWRHRDLFSPETTLSIVTNIDLVPILGIDFVDDFLFNNRNLEVIHEDGADFFNHRRTSLKELLVPVM